MIRSVPTMKILNFLVAVITLLSFSAVTPSAEAGPLSKIDYQLTEEYATHPDHFFSGSGIGTGAIRKYKKSTLNVEQYNPPYYLISIDVVYLYYQIDTDSYVAHIPSRERFYYNWETKKAYKEYPIPGTQEHKWEEITNNFRNEKGIANDVFKLAYNMDFFSPAELKP